MQARIQDNIIKKKNILFSSFDTSEKEWQWLEKDMT